MKIYAYDILEPDEHLKETLRVKDIIDPFVGTDYWVKCWVDKVNARWGDDTWHMVPVGNSYPWWVQFNEIMGSFYEIHYLYSDSVLYEKDKDVVMDTLVGIVELGFIHPVEPVEVMADMDMFNPDIEDEDYFQ